MAYVHSFGCQQNVNDGEKIRGVLQDVGFGLTDTLEQADLILFNTCAVREHAEQRVFGNVGALKQLKEKNPKLVIGVCGCMAQQPHIVEKLRRSYPYVDPCVRRRRHRPPCRHAGRAFSAAANVT